MTFGGSRNKKGVKDSKPLVTIVTVTYNASKYLESCIESVLALSIENIEHIIIDGNSQDGTVEILKKYDDQVAFWLTEPDNGIYDAMNKAIRYARGSWLLFLGADDKLLPQFSEMLPKLNDPSAIYYGDYYYENEVLGKAFTSYRLSKSNICHQNIFYPQAVFEKYNYLVEYKVSADYFLNIQCWADKEFKFIYYPFSIAHYASGGFSSVVVDEKFNSDLKKNIKKYLGNIVYYRYRFKQFRKQRRAIQG